MVNTIFLLLVFVWAVSNAYFNGYRDGYFRNRDTLNKFLKEKYSDPGDLDGKNSDN